jgi:hypothetical protein
MLNPVAAKKKRKSAKGVVLTPKHQKYAGVAVTATTRVPIKKMLLVQRTFPHANRDIDI